VFGLAGWRGETGRRCLGTTVAYLAAFAVVGQPFNEYWGLLYAPLLPLGIAQAPAALRDLIQSLRQKKLSAPPDALAAIPWGVEQADFVKAAGEFWPRYNDRGLETFFPGRRDPLVK